MRLIDADKLLEYLDKPNVLTNRLSPEDKETARNIVKSQPTAYDIDRVVEKLKEKAKEYQETKVHYSLFCCANYDAIEIVKAGEKNEID